MPVHVQRGQLLRSTRDSPAEMDGIADDGATTKHDNIAE